MRFQLVAIGVLFLVFFSCKNESKPIIQSIDEERWTLKEVNGEYVKDTINFLESYRYNSDGEEEGHLFYNLDGSLKAKSLHLFTEGEKLPIGAQYLNAADEVLSYYDFENQNGQKITSKGYDASTKELLRIEEFSYDNKGHLKTKYIHNADGQLMRTINYTTDQYGNEMEVAVMESDGTLVLRERFEIKKYDEHHNWVEKWGFAGELPFSYRVRRIQYYN